MGKKKSKGKRQHNIHPSAKLNSALANLFTYENLENKDKDTLKSDLDLAIEKVKIYDSINSILKFYFKAEQDIQIKLDELIPEWLNEREHSISLYKLLENGNVNKELEQISFDWLEKSGFDSQIIKDFKEFQPFYKAFAYNIDLSFKDIKNGGSGFVIIYFYTSIKKHKIFGFDFLIAHYKPWNCSVKDFFIHPAKTPEIAVRDVKEFWKQGRLKPDNIDMETARDLVIGCLENNLEFENRIPSELIREKKRFFDYIINNPDGSPNDDFTEEDFDDLCELDEMIDFDDIDFLDGLTTFEKDGKTYVTNTKNLKKNDIDNLPI